VWVAVERYSWQTYVVVCSGTLQYAVVGWCDGLSHRSALGVCRRPLVLPGVVIREAFRGVGGGSITVLLLNGVRACVYSG
jgi:hypothetical protein